MPNSNPILISFWIEATDTGGPVGFGVTAWSLEDAFDLIREGGYGIDADRAIVRRNIRPHEVDPAHIGPNSGPFVFRGVWYPCLNIGLGASGQ